MSRLLKLTTAYILYFTIIIVFVFSVLHFNNKLPNKNNNLAKDTRLSDTENLIIPSNINDKYIILTFDDGWSSQYEAFKMIKPIKGTLYICSSFIGQENRLTLDNLTEMYNNGWDISNHTVHHANLTKVSLEKAYDEIYGCSAWIKGHGFIRDNAYKHFAYPEGGYDESILKILKDQDFLTARTTNPGNDTTNPLQLGRTSLHGMTKKNIRDNILSDRKLIILSFHRIIPDDSTDIKDIDLKESYFKEVMSAIHESGRQVITISEWYKLNGQ